MWNCQNYSKKSKKIMISVYRPPSQKGTYFFEKMGKSLGFYSESREYFVLIDDFNCVETNANICNFMETNNLANRI